MSRLSLLFFALLFIHTFDSKGTPPISPPDTVLGYTAPGFEKVAQVFHENFNKRGEKGAALTVYYKDTIVVELYGGYINNNNDIWNENTLVLLFSGSKGLVALTTALSISDGLFNLSDKITTHWPDFAKNGKEKITVEQMLNHQAGVPLLDVNLKSSQLNNIELLTRVLENQTPLWTPGMAQGYHLYSSGLYIGELIRRTDPEHRSFDKYFYDRIATPLGLEIYFGIPDTISQYRLAQIIHITSAKRMYKIVELPKQLQRRLINPFSLINKTFRILIGFNPNDREFLKSLNPSANAVGRVKDVAKLYWIFSKGAHELKLKNNVFTEMTLPPYIMPHDNEDKVLGIPMYYRFGFRKPSVHFPFGTSHRAFGMSGAGGTFAFADPDIELGYCYATTKMSAFAQNDPREVALRKALYECIRIIKN